MPRLDATPPVTKMCFAKTSALSRATIRDAKRPLATVPCGPPRPRAPLPCPSMTATATPSAAVDAHRHAGSGAHWRVDARRPRAVAVVLLRLPALFADPVARVRRRRVRVVGAGDARRRAAVPRRLLEPGAGVPAARVGRRPRSGSARWTRRACSRSRPACCSPIAVYSCARRVTSRGHALLAAGLVTTSGSVLWVTGPGERRRPVDGAVGARDRARAARARPRRPAPAGTRSGSGSPAGARGVDQGAVGAGGRDRRPVVLLLCRRRVRDAALAAGDRDRRVRGDRAAVGTRPGVGPVVHVPQRRAPVEHPRRTPRGRSSTRSGTATSLVLVALALALVTFARRAVSRMRRRAAAPRRAAARSASSSRVLVLWVVLVFALLVWEPALFRAHVAQLVPPLALLASAPAAAVDRCSRSRPWWSRRSGRRATTSILWPARLPRERGRGGAAPRALPGDALVISDDPGLGVARRARTTRRTSPTRRSSASNKDSITEAIAGRRGGRVARRLRRGRRRRRSTSGASTGSASRLRGGGLPVRAVRRHHRLRRDTRCRRVIGGAT